MIRRLVSPVFFSTARDGQLQRGLGALPDQRPLLLVGNHQTLALDLGIMVEQIVRERGFLPRGLAHPAIFAVCPAPLSLPRRLSTVDRVLCVPPALQALRLVKPCCSGHHPRKD